MRNPSKPQITIEQAEAILALNDRMLRMVQEFEAKGTFSVTEAEQEMMRKEYAAIGGEDFYRDEVLPVMIELRKLCGQQVVR